MGIDAMLAEAQSLFEQSFCEPRLRPHTYTETNGGFGMVGEENGQRNF